MVDPVTSPASPPGPTAGALLRAAREQQGLHIAALGAAIKVPVAKLEALEADQYALLPDAGFTRALALTICRALKIDPKPVLARLPHADPAALDQVAGSLNTPFRERALRDSPSLDLRAMRPLAWGGALLLVAAAVVYFLPSGAWQPATQDDADAPAEVTAPVDDADVEPALTRGGEPAAPTTTAATAVDPVVETVHDAPPIAQAASADVAAALVQLRAGDASWVQVQDGSGRTLLSRMVQAGETVGFDGTLPIRLTIGNAPATELRFRGQPVDLAPLTRNAVARVELK